jgi:hypothetical protein
MATQSNISLTSLSQPWAKPVIVTVHRPGKQTPFGCQGDPSFFMFHVSYWSWCFLSLVTPLRCILKGICSTFLSAVRPELKVRKGTIAFSTSGGLSPEMADNRGRREWSLHLQQPKGAKWVRICGKSANRPRMCVFSLSLSLSESPYLRTPTSSKSHSWDQRDPPKIGAHQPQTGTSPGWAVLSDSSPTIGSYNCLTEPHVADVALVAVTSHPLLDDDGRRSPLLAQFLVFSVSTGSHFRVILLDSLTMDVIGVFGVLPVLYHFGESRGATNMENARLAFCSVFSSCPYSY